MKPCNVAGCEKPHYAKGFCRLHYRRKTEGKHGLTTPPCRMCGGQIVGRKAEAEFCSVSCQMKWNRRFGCYTPERLRQSCGVCSVDGCSAPVKAHGMCNLHRIRMLRHGDPTVNMTKRVPAVCSKCGKPTGRGKAKGMCFNCYFMEYYRANAPVERARRNARRTRVVQATPPWADMTAIRKFYLACPPGHEVDHVVPLKGRRVSGLHVLDNLQYLPQAENRAKLNRFAA